MRLSGMPLELHAVRAETRTNSAFRDFDLSRWDVAYLPGSLLPLLDEPPIRSEMFVEDDNRGAVLPDPVATLDGVPFYLSVKGVGSPVDPFSHHRLDRAYAAEMTDDPDVRARLLRPSPGNPERMLTGELWLRGSPYGGQGIEHGSIALQVSERADLTSIRGFLIAPVVKMAMLPPALEERVRGIRWYRKYRGRMVQELRLVPSNIRVYFHARNTIGNDIRHIFDLWGIDSDAKALDLEVHFLRSCIALLTLYARTMRFDAAKGKYRGLDLLDVWLDKDAVFAPNGSVYFVDLEGIEEVAVDPEDVKEKIEDQVYRGLYEFMFGYEQIDQERRRRFGDTSTRRGHFASVLPAALAPDPYVRVVEAPGQVDLEIRNACSEERLNMRFPLLDR